MGSSNSTNKGSQSIGFQFQEEARAALFNRNNDGIIPAGLYSLGSPVATLGAMVGAFYTGIFINPLVVLIRDNNQDPLTPGVFPRIETTTPYLVPFQTGSLGYVDVSKPYIVLRFGWAESQSIYMDFCKVTSVVDPSSADINKLWPNDLIIGQILYDDLGGGNFKLRQTGPIMDFTKSSWSFIPGKQAESRELLVQSNDADQTKVYVTGGWLTTGKGKYDIAGAATAAISATPSAAGSAGRIDLVWVDESGVVHVTEGTPSPAPATPAIAPPYNNRKVLAEIRRAGSRSTIEGPEIFNFKTTRDGMLLQGGGSSLNADLWDGIDSEFALMPRGTMAGASNVFTVLNALPVSGQWDFPATCTNTPEGAGASAGIWTIEQRLFQSSTLASNNGYAIAYRQGVRELWWNTVVNGTFGAWKKIWVDETGREVLRTSILTEWQADVTYALHNGIVRNGQPYRSKIASNLNIDPATDGPVYANWELTGGGSGSSSFLGTAGVNIAQYQWVYEDGTGKFQIADKSSQAGSDVVGIATQTVLANASLSVQTSGVIVGAGSGLTPGARCYLGASGSLTQNEASIAIGQCRISVGIAISATDILIDILEPVLMYSNSTVPSGLGDAMLWTLSSGSLPPTHVPADGRLVSRSLYPDAFTLWGTTFSAGDGVTTFGVIDMSNLNVVNDQGVVTGFWAIRMYPLSIVLASQVFGATGSAQTTLMANDLSQATDAVGWTKSGTNINTPAWDPSTLIGSSGSLKGGFLVAGLTAGDYLAISPVFAVSPFDVGKAWKIAFGFKVDATYTDGDFGVFLNDGTNDIPTGIVINGVGGALQTIQGAAYPSTATSYSFRIKALNSRAATINFWLGKLTIFPQVQIQVPALSSEQVWTPTFTGLGTVSLLDAKYTRVGNKLKGLVRVQVGVPTGVEAQMTLPSGLTTDSLIPTLEIAGTLTVNGAGANSYFVLQEASKAYITFGIQNSTTAGFIKAIGTVFSASAIISFIFEVTIAQWGSSINMAGSNEPMYLSNSETVADTTGVIGKSYYGVEGAAILAHTVQTIMNITLPRIPLPNEPVEIELRSKIDKSWVKMINAGTSTTRPPNSSDYDAANTSRTWGIRIVKTTTGQIQVYFGAFMGINFSGATSSWSTWMALADSYDRWRIRIGQDSVNEAIPKVRAEYSNADGAAQNVAINFSTVAEDTHGCVTIGAGVWKFTCRYPGIYLVNLAVNSTNQHSYELRKNGSSLSPVKYIAANPSAASSNLSFGSRSIRLAVGDYIDVRDTTGANVASANAAIEIIGPM